MRSTFSSAFENIRLEFQAAGAIFSSAFTSIHTLNIEIKDRRSVLPSTPNTLEYPAMGWTFSSAFENIHLEYRAVNSIFSSAFKTKQSLYCELWDRHSSLHSKTLILNTSCGINIQLRIQHHEHFKYRSLGSTFSTAIKNIHV